MPDNPDLSSSPGHVDHDAPLNDAPDHPDHLGGRGPDTSPPSDPPTDDHSEAPLPSEPALAPQHPVIVRLAEDEEVDIGDLTPAAEMSEQSGYPESTYATRGEVYHRILDEGWAEKYFSGECYQSEIAEELGYTQGGVSRGFKAIREDIWKYRNHGKFKEKVRQSKWPVFIDLYDMDDDELRELVAYFGEWRATHFKDPRHNPYTLPAHQAKWAFHILRAIRDGGQLLILSPPRHGKTELLTHLDCFLITRVNPNIRLVRVCKSEGLAKKALGSTLDMLENCESLIAETLPEGASYRPPFKSRRPWTAGEFVVSTRTITGLKSPTMAAVGAGGTLLSRDGDVFVLDDVEDHRTTLTPEGRESTRDWFANDFNSRKEPWTAFIAIGSRQHPDDLWGHIIDDPEWEVIIERAHDDDNCEIDDPENPENWDKHQDCMLWPEVRDFRWLMGRKNSETVSRTFALTYQNYPQDADTDVFTRELVESCFDHDRITLPVFDDPRNARELVPDPFYDDNGTFHPVRLIAGLDPSVTGYQAAFLWGYDPAAHKLYAVYYENRLGGGIQPAREIVGRWLEWFGVRYWVIEENLYKGGIVNDELLRMFAQRESVTIVGHETWGNKWNPDLGVTALAGVMKDGRISIPAGDEHSRQFWSTYRKQLVNFSRDRKPKGTRTRRLSDIVMASWFPWETVLSWRRSWLSEQTDYQYDDEGMFVDMALLYNQTFGRVPIESLTEPPRRRRVPDARHA